MSRPSHRSRLLHPHPVHSRERGFSLIELMFVVAVVSALAGLLIPAVQKAREPKLRDRAAKSLKAIGDGAQHFYEEEHSAGPLLDLTTLADFCKTHPCDPAVAHIAQGHELEGYWFDLAGGRDSWHAVAEPLFPGVTGDETLTIDISGNITPSPTPFAEYNRRRAMARIVARGAEIVGGLLTLHPDAAASVHDALASPETVPQVFASLDLNGDATLTLAELNRPLGQPGPVQGQLGPIQGFLAFVAEELKWNSSGEDLDAIGVDLAALQLPAVEDGVVGPLFTYDGLCRVGLAMPHHPTFVRVFCRGLDAAQKAAERGDTATQNRIIDALKIRVEAQAGKGILRKDANALIGLLRVLRAGA